MTGDGVSVQALMAERAYHVDVTAKPIVDKDADTIYVGDPEDPFKDAEKVTYKKGSSGTDIGGLTDGTEYWVIVKDDGRIQLAASEQDAKDGKAIDLDDPVDGGNAHVLERTGTLLDPVDNFQFDPNGDHFEIDFDDLNGLTTGDAVVYKVGGGSSAIGGLTADTTYYAVVKDGKLQFADSFENAVKGKAIELTGAGTGDEHAFVNASHSASVDARSGAAGGKTGVAGHVAVNIVTGRTLGEYGDNATITLAEADNDSNTAIGASNIQADATSLTLTRALPGTAATGSTTGVGLGFAIGYSAYDTDAQIVGSATVAGTAGDLSVDANGDHTVVTLAGAGTASNGTAVAGAVALGISNNTTDAKILAGTGLEVDGNLSITADSALRQTTEANAEVTGKGGTGVGAAIALGWADDDVTARLARNVSKDVLGETIDVIADNVKVEAKGTITATVLATASAKGEKNSNDGGQTSQEQTSSQTDFVNTRTHSSLTEPTPQTTVANANNQSQSQTSN
ncbi:MAG: hypothetical protein Q7V62_11935, partial [Actinomycetota bacterium]|nr:hypothetical protein [Actinomycetota bacterium]